MKAAVCNKCWHAFDKEAVNSLTETCPRCNSDDLTEYPEFCNAIGCCDCAIHEAHCTWRFCQDSDNNGIYPTDDLKEFRFARCKQCLEPACPESTAEFERPYRYEIDGTDIIEEMIVRCTKGPEAVITLPKGWEGATVAIVRLQY